MPGRGKQTEGGDKSRRRHAKELRGKQERGCPDLDTLLEVVGWSPTPESRLGE
jgi:hypothetical protein